MILLKPFLKPVDYIYDEEQYVSHCESTEVAIEKALGLRVLPWVHHQQGEAVADNANNRHDIAAAAENKLVHNIRHWTRECVTKCCVSRDGGGIKADTLSKQGASELICPMIRNKERGQPPLHPPKYDFY